MYNITVNACMQHNTPIVIFPDFFPCENNSNLQQVTTQSKKKSLVGNNIFNCVKKYACLQESKYPVLNKPSTILKKPHFDESFLELRH